MFDIFLDALLDSLKLIPFLFLTYLVLEWIEHKMNDKAITLVNRAGKLGPVIGGLLGIVPQCGFSAATSNLYAGGLVTTGTLIAVFLSTSDEMLPILISESVEPTLIIKILAVKVVSAVLVGVLLDTFFKKRNTQSIHDLCEGEHSHCGCEHNIFLAALRHTGQIILFIFIISFALNLVIESVGVDSLSSFVFNVPIIGEILAGLVGLIPNCASSVVITELYLQGGMSAGAMLSGLLTGSGVGLLILFRTNQNLKDNLRILAILYGSGVLCGILAGAMPIF